MAQPQHPITLDQLFFTRSSVIAVQGHVPGEVKFSVPPENKIHVQKIEGAKRTYQGTMRTILNAGMDPKSPYSIDMECIAFFSVDESLTEEEAARGVMITAHSVIYGAIRESVAWLTGRQPFGPLVLGLSVLQSASPESTPME